MKKAWVVLLVLLASNAFCELTIVQTSFRKAPLSVVSQLSEKGNAEAQLELALRNYAGYQVSKSAETAFLWMRKSAEKNHPVALELLSQMYAEGIGVSVDSQQAERWLVAALVQSPKDSRLQKRFEQVVAAKKAAGGDAETFLRQCAEAGYSPARVAVYYPVATRLYENGKYEEALSLFKDLSEDGDAGSTYYLARMYAKGQGGLLQDESEAFRLYQQAANGGSESAQCELAAMSDQALGAVLDPRDVATLYEQAAKNGSADAQYRLAEVEFAAALDAETLALSDLGEEDVRYKNQYTKRLRNAVSGYRAAAAQSHPDALYMLGRLSASGEGVQQDFSQAVQYYEAAAEQGSARALFYLGLMKHAGLGGAADMVQAISLYKAAAELGDAGALFYLGNCYRFGVGVPQYSPRGENFYCQDVLKGVDPAPGQWNDAFRDLGRWGVAAAREYGAILWERAVSPAELAEAERWVGLASISGDESARDLYFKMKQRDFRSKSSVVVREHRVNPEADAVRRCRALKFFPYVQFPLKELYPRTLAESELISVDISSDDYKTMTGVDARGLSVRYTRPSRFQAIEFSGIVFAGVELTDLDSGERYFSSNTYLDEVPACASVSSAKLFMSVNQERFPDAEVSGWAVVYGHLLPDGRTVAVFDTREYGVASFSDLIARNQSSVELSSQMVFCSDAWSIMEISLGDIDETAAKRVGENVDKQSKTESAIENIIKIITPGD